MIYITNFRESLPKRDYQINTTSSAKLDWEKELSPFYLGPVNLYNFYQSRNLENAWQFCKVYDEHMDSFGNPTEEYFVWACKGWNDSFAHRYPKGKGAKPVYSFWDGRKLNYIEARKEIYIPLYVKAVVKTNGYKKLKDHVKQAEIENRDVYLIDYDGYNHIKMGMKYRDVIENKSLKMGHAFVLGMLLEGIINEKDFN